MIRPEYCSHGRTKIQTGQALTPMYQFLLDSTVYQELTDQVANVLAVKQRTEYVPLHHTCQDRRAEHDKGSRENEGEKEEGEKRNNAILCQNYQ